MKSSQKRHRLIIIELLIFLGFFAILARLFYWQILRGDELTAIASNQYERKVIDTASRGNIFSSDNYLLVGNQPVFRLFLEKNLINQESQKIAQQLTPILLSEDQEYLTATQSAEKEILSIQLENNLKNKIENAEKNWVGLRGKISQNQKEKISALKLAGVGFEEFEERYYPEASMAAQVFGFVGKNEAGEDTGYFGIEGELNNELKGFTTLQKKITDALGLKLFFDKETQPVLNGRDVSLTLRRDIQTLIENKLKNAMQKYDAEAGEVIVLEPKTGKILGLASYPNYDPTKFYLFDPKTYKNPAAIDLYEPGSTLKVLTIAAGIEEGAITPQTECPRCQGPRKIDKYTIRTWNDEYHPNINMAEALAKSDNTAMIFVAEELGVDKFKDYLQKFGISQATGLELQEDHETVFPQKWGPVELATRSFGQGISTTSLQLTRAIGAIANDGLLMKLSLIDWIRDSKTQEKIVLEPQISRQVVSQETAKKVQEMMHYAAKKGEAQWAFRDQYPVAAKTGTSQIPNPEGGYLEDATIASFIGFSPIEEPKFVMFVKLTKPQSSPWAAETAAPLWYDIADDLHLLL